MKVLIVTYDMVPHAFTWGGCQRMYFLAKKLKESDIETQVVALRSATYNTFGKELLENTIFTEPRPETKAVENFGCVAESASSLKSILKKVAFFIDKILFNEIQPGNGLKAYQRFGIARKVLKDLVKKEKFDVAVISGPPFVIFDAIPMIKSSFSGTRIVMDYRDPWNYWHEGNCLTTHREKILQRMSDAVVCTNEALCLDMAARFGIPASKCHVIANGYADDLEKNNILKQKSNDRAGRFEVVYTGAIAFNDVTDGYRDTTQLIVALRELKDEGINNITLTFVGAANPDTDEAKRLRQEFGEAIKIVGHVSSLEAKKYIAAAEACLLLHTTDDSSGKYLISGKLYDYIQQKKYILSIASGQSQHAEILKKYGIGINAENNKDHIKQMLKEAYKAWIDHRLEAVYDNVDINTFSRSSQIDKYINLIKQL